MRINRRMTTVLAITFIALMLNATRLSAQAVNESNLLNLIKKNAPESLIIKAISMAKTIDIDTSFDGTVALMNKGVSQTIVDALIQRKEQLNPQQPAVAVAPVNLARTDPVIASSGISKGYPEKNGVYYKSDSGWMPLEKVPMQEMTQNFSKIGNPFARKTMGQKIDGPEAPVKVGIKPEFCIIGTDVSVRALMVIKLEKRGKNRELVMSSVNALGKVKSLEYDKLDGLDVQKKSDKEITVQFSQELKQGEYVLKISDTGGMTVGEVYDFSVRK